MRVLVVGPEFYLYNDSICNAFKEIGCEAEILAYSERVIFGESTNLANRLLHPGDSKGIMEFPARTVTDVRRFIKSKDLLIGPEVLESRRFGRGVEKRISEGGFDLLFAIKGNGLLPETLSRIKAKTKTKAMLWMLDSFELYPLVSIGLDLYDATFVIEPTDIDWLKNRGFDSFLLPGAFDPNIYRRLHDDSKTDFERDIVLVGEGRPERCQALGLLSSRLADEGMDCSIGIFGPKWEEYEMGLKRDSSSGSIKWEFNHKNIHPIQVNEIYNKSRICLNIHHSQIKTGLNPRTFEIAGSGSLEIVDRKPTLHQFFTEGRELLAYGTVSELPELVIECLNSPDMTKNIAKAGYVRANREHRYLDRICTIMKYF